MQAKNEYYPDLVLHPCFTLREKLKEMKMSQKEFALRTGKPEKTIIAVLKGESSITPQMAVLFENITKIPAYFWINKQALYNEHKARKLQENDIRLAEDWARSFPYAEMATRNWVPKTRKIEEKTAALFDYFAISTHDAWKRLYLDKELKVAAFASLKHTHEPHAISAWLRQGELQAEKIDSDKFDRKHFVRQLEKIRQLMVLQPVDFFLQLQTFCIEAGVKVFYTTKLPKVPISGSTRWIRDTPVIQLTARYKQNDRFWFTFFHEAGHIVLHGKKYISLENIDFSEADQGKEQEAHAFAEQWTLTRDQENEVIQAGTLNRMKVLAYAKKFNTHPAMIIGRLQYKGEIPYTIGREFIVPIDLSSVDVLH
jgi:HTH-type transcriptional regulator / antitoxin HigA